MESIGPTTYKTEMPEGSDVHLVLHVSNENICSSNQVQLNLFLHS